MRPDSLQITGLNSFRQTARVDFGELLKDGLFGIFGPTGSGKSTILDAITLALFGRVHRAGGTQGIINMAERSCTVSFGFSMRSPGGRKRYMVERRLLRTKSGNAETKTVRLIEYDGDRAIPRAEKATEVGELIQQIIGIGHDDFQRAVVLPQGAFARFLELKDRERNAMLERLFGLQDLGMRLNGLLRSHETELALRRAEVDARLQELRAYDDDALIAARQRCDAAVEERDRARVARDAAEQRYTADRTLAELITERQALLAGEDERRVQEVERELLRERIARAERSAGVAPLIAAFEGAAARARASEERYQLAVREKDGAEEQLDRITTARERASRRYDERYDALGRDLEVLEGVRRGKKGLIEQRDQLKARSRSIAEQREALSLEQRECEAARTALEGTDAAIARLTGEVAQHRIGAEERVALDEWSRGNERLRALRAALAGTVLEHGACSAAQIDAADAARTATAAEAAAAAALEGLRLEQRESKGRHATLLAQRETLLADALRIRHAAEEAGRIQQEIDACAIELRDLDERLGQLDAALREAITDEAQATSSAEGLRSAFDRCTRQREHLHRDHVLASLAQGLADGDPCPLCGAPDHPSPHTISTDVAETMAALEAELLRATEALRDAEGRLRDAQAVRVAAETERRALDDTRAVAAGRRKRADAALEQLIDRITWREPIPGAAGLSDCAREIGERVSAAERSLADLDDAMAGLEARATAHEQTRAAAALDGARRSAEAAAAAERADALKREVDRLRAEGEVLEGELVAAAGVHSMEELEALLARISERDRIVEASLVELRALDDQRRAGAERASALERSARERELALVADSAGLQELENEVELKTKELQGAFESIVPQAERAAVPSVERALEVRGEERRQIREEFEREQQRYNDASAVTKSARLVVENYWADLCRDRIERDEAERASGKAVAEQGFETVAQVRAWLMAPEELTSARATVQEIEEALNRAARRLTELNEAIADRTITDDDLLASAAELAAASERFEEALHAVGEAEGALRTCVEKNAEWKKTSRDDVQAAEGAATAEQLSKYLRGNGFIEYLANERLADVCRRASTQLAELTGGRYQILSRPREGFLVRDFANGGGERSPGSLSGGETFLVSLSLALALSDTIQLGHAPLEFFFLDEGFGTLDSDLLETVMNTLERLRSDHRAIGVISHVAQLRERIGRRLMVIPASDVDGSTVRFELG